MTKNIIPTGNERFFEEDEIIVSKTDTKGRITYTNDTFIKISGYKEKKLIGKPHSLIRHQDMPRCVFKLLWDTLESKNEIFAYVVNMAKNGDHYWVFAHVTPSYDNDGNIIAYHSNRRVPRREPLENVIIPLYKTLLDEEKKHNNRKEGMQSAFNMLLKILEEKGVGYDEFILSI